MCVTWDAETDGLISIFGWRIVGIDLVKFASGSKGQSCVERPMHVVRIQNSRYTRMGTARNNSTLRAGTVPSISYASKVLPRFAQKTSTSQAIE